MTLSYCQQASFYLNILTVSNFTISSICIHMCCTQKKLYYNTPSSWISMLDLAKHSCYVHVTIEICCTVLSHILNMCLYRNHTCLWIYEVSWGVGRGRKKKLPQCKLYLFKAYNNIWHRILNLLERNTKSSVHPITRCNIPKDTSLQHHC